MTKPTYRAYVVEDAPEGSERKARWIEVGAVWPHKSGKGFDLVIPAGLSVAGRIVCMPPKDEAANAPIDDAGGF
jgi:hypothetical protein